MPCIGAARAGGGAAVKEAANRVAQGLQCQAGSGSGSGDVTGSWAAEATGSWAEAAEASQREEEANGGREGGRGGKAH